MFEDLGDEVIAYDPATAVAHVLSPMAAGVLLLCDGESDEDSIARSLAVDGAAVDVDVVRQALASLDAVGLLAPDQP